MLSAVSGCLDSGSSLGKDIVATVGGSPITLDDFKYASGGEMLKSTEEKKDLLWRLINNKLAAREAVAEGLMTDPEALNGMEEFYNDRLPDYLFKKINGEIKVTDDELLAYRKDDIKPVLGVSLIVSPTVEAAEAALAELKNGGRFGEVAAKRSSLKGDTDREIKLEEDFYPAGVRAVLNRMKPGEISPIMKLDIGYAVFKVNYRKEADQRWDEFKENIRKTVRQRKFEAEKAKLIDRLRSAASIKIDKKVGADGEPLYLGATVNGIRLRMEQSLFTPDDPHSPHGRMNAKTLRDALNKRINDVLLSQEARRLNLQQDPGFQRELNLKKEEVLASVMLERVRGSYEPTPRDIKDYYEKNKERFAVNTQVRISRMLFDKKEDAEAALREIKSGKDFASVVKERSMDTVTKDNGGDVGYVMPDKLKEPMRSAISGMKTGDVSGVIKSDYGYEVLKATGRIEGGEPVMANISSTLRKRAMLAKQSENVEAFYKKLRDKADIKVNTKLLESL